MPISHSAARAALEKSIIECPVGRKDGKIFGIIIKAHDACCPLPMANGQCSIAIL